MTTMQAMQLQREAQIAVMAAAPPNATAIEALKHMRDTTNSRQQYDRAVEALKQMGVENE